MSETPKPPRRRKAEPAPTTPDPIEIAMEAEASGEAPAGIAHEVLLRQAQLLRWQVAGERAGVALKLLTALAGLVAAAAVSLMVWRAAHANGFVVEPFSTPPALAARGLDGATLAKRFGDQLVRIAIFGRGVEPRRSVTASLSDGVSIPIPTTGVSLDQLEQWLRNRLGRESRVTGEVAAAPDGRLTLTARIGATVLPTQTGSEAELPAMLQRLAEAAYAVEQPVSAVIYLHGQGRYEESVPIINRMIASPAPFWRARGMSQMGSVVRAREGPDAAAKYLRATLALYPGQSASLLSILGSTETASLGEMEAAYRRYLQVPALLRIDTLRSEEAKRVASLDVRRRIAQLSGDATDEISAAEALSLSTGAGFIGDPNLLQLRPAAAYLARHEVERARVVVEGFTPLGPTGATAQTEGRYKLAVATGDWATALALHGRLHAADRYPDQERVAKAERAMALTHLGRAAEAEAVLAGTGPNCQPCVLAAAEAAEALDRPADAEAKFALAARMAPSLPQASYHWAQARFARGDLAGALAQALEAERRGPRWADPLKLEGDIRLRQGDPKAAAAHYAAAARLAPRWGALHLKWGDALTKLGKAEEARAKWLAAAGMDLTAADRAELSARRAS